MLEEACCTCAALLSAIPPQYDEKSEKPVAQDRRLDCCGRVICAKCVAGNQRFASYCPFCQISSATSSLPPGLRDPPTYSPPASPRPAHATLASPPDDQPPAYSSLDPQAASPEKHVSSSNQPGEDVLHFLDPSQDTIPSLSLRYGVPQDVLRRTNGLYANHLLAARRTILIPGEYYKGGTSLSPQPIDGEEEEIRKGKVRRWMVACKVPDYDVALLYLNQAKYDLDAAVEAYMADERWEKENPMGTSSKGKTSQTLGRRRLDAHDRYKCYGLLTQGRWLDSPKAPNIEPPSNWQPPGCMLHEYDAKDISTCLKSRKIVFAGDSTIRQIFWATARKLDAKGADEARYYAEKHEDVSFSRAEVTLEFIWDPFLNTSSLHQQLAVYRDAQDTRVQGDQEGRKSPAIVLIGGGLWHAQHFSKDSLKPFKDSVDTLTWLADDGEHGVSRQLNSPSSRNGPNPEDRVVFAPVQVPWYDSLSSSHAASLTAANINPLNEHLQELSTQQKALVAWSYYFMILQRKPVYEEDGLHVVDTVARRKADVLLNMRCNAEVTRRTKYPMDKTCCSDYVRMSWIQLAIVSVSLWTLPLLVWVTSGDINRQPWLPSAKISRALLVLGLTMSYCFFADRTQIFNKTQKQYSSEEFTALSVITIGLGVLSIRRSVTLPICKGSLQDFAPKNTDQPFLSRDQTDEWKGWMQFAILIYHYTGASKVLWIYKIIRILVASYLFMTGFGHTVFFYKKADYSLRRCASVLVRLNLLSCILPYVMRTDYLFYYFAPLISFWYIVIYLTMRIRHSWNYSLRFLLSKILISAIIVTAVIKIPSVFEGLFRLLRKTCGIDWNVTEWRFRLQLDNYIVYIGMVAAIMFIRISDALGGEHPMNGHLKVIHARFSRLRTIYIVGAIAIIPGFWFLTRRSSDKYDYNWWVPYISCFPILSFIVLRNSSRHARNFYSSIFVWLGRCSLETFTLQFHIWMAADTKGLLSLGSLRQTATRTESRWVDFVLLTITFFWVSWHVAAATTRITSWIVDPSEGRSEVESSELQGLPSIPLDLPRTKSDNALNGSLERHRAVVSRSTSKLSKLVRDDLKVRLVLILGVMWLLNQVY